MNSSPLILASASPRRRELLAQLGIPFEVAVCTLNEPARRPGAVRPAAWAMALAYFKARAVADGRAAADKPSVATGQPVEDEVDAVAPRPCVLGADTIVVCGAEVLGKPRDAADARRMLRLQAGRETDVITGVALVRAGRQAGDVSGVFRRIAAATTRVFMRDDPAEIETYMKGGDWAGKAGAYGIQDAGDRLIERIDGSFSNVVGLPLELVARLLSVG